MVTAMVIMNVVCFAVGLVLLARVWRPVGASDAAADFAAALASFRPMGTADALPGTRQPGPTDRRAESAPATYAGETAEGSLHAVAVSGRLAMVRHMLEGKTVAETAAAAHVTPSVVRALYRLHGRDEDETCL
jgi:hypothetical protein